jgi:hypothetical protein
MGVGGGISTDKKIKPYIFRQCPHTLNMGHSRSAVNLNYHVVWLYGVLRISSNDLPFSSSRSVNCASYSLSHTQALLPRTKLKPSFLKLPLPSQNWRRQCKRSRSFRDFDVLAKHLDDGAIPVLNLQILLMRPASAFCSNCSCRPEFPALLELPHVHPDHQQHNAGGNR